MPYPALLLSAGPLMALLLVQSSMESAFRVPRTRLKIGVRPTCLYTCKIRICEGCSKKKSPRRHDAGGSLYVSLQKCYGGRSPPGAVELLCAASPTRKPVALVAEPLPRIAMGHYTTLCRHGASRMRGRDRNRIFNQRLTKPKRKALSHDTRRRYTASHFRPVCPTPDGNRYGVGTDPTLAV